MLSARRQRLQLDGRLPLEAYRLPGSQDRRNAVKDAAQARSEGTVEPLRHHVFQHVEVAFSSALSGSFRATSHQVSPKLSRNRLAATRQGSFTAFSDPGSM